MSRRVVHESLSIYLNSELEVEADVLGHEPHQAAGQADAPVPGGAAEHSDVPGLDILAAEDTRQQGGLTASAGAKKGEYCAPLDPHGKLGEDSVFAITHNHLVHGDSVGVHVQTNKLLTLRWG